jgi:hypothetical protein
MKAATDLMLAIAAIAPPLRTAQFGPGVNAHYFKPTWVLNDAAIKGDTIYVIYTQPGRYSRPLLGLLRNGLILNIPLKRVYVSLAFVDDDADSQGIRVMGGVDSYSINGAPATLIARPSGRGRTMFTLTDGNICVEGGASSGIAVSEMDKSHHTRAILTTNELKAATDGLLDRAFAIRCNHFHGEDFATVGTAITVVFRLVHNKATLISTGRVFVSDAKHLLIQSDNFELLKADAR